MMHVIEPGGCIHARWCKAKKGEAHDEACPRNVLKMSLGDVDAFCAQYVTVYTSALGAEYLIGRFKGLEASASLTFSDCGDKNESRRWIAENLTMIAREQGL